MSGEEQKSSHQSQVSDQDRAISLFTFLKELTQLRSKTVRSVEQYEKLLWLADVPREPGCHCAAWGGGPDSDTGETWLEIRKPRLKPHPKPAPDLEPWLRSDQLPDSSRELPELREEIVVAVTGEVDAEAELSEGTEVKRIEDCPQVKDLWERYVEDRWWPWAEEDRRLQRVQRVYTELFAIYQRQQRLGEQYEVVLGLGLLTWRTPGGQEIRRHLVTAQTSLAFEAARGVISLGPAGEGAKPSLEQDMIDPHYCPDALHVQAFEKEVLEVGEEIWDRARVHSILSGWVHAVSSDGRFDDSLAPQETVSTEPLVHLAPAVILRRRTDRAFLRVFTDILEQLRRGKPVPAGVKRFVTMGDDDPEEGGFGDDYGRDVPVGGGEIRDLYLPLEVNEDQRKIVERLATHQGVLVQGPPGTGKSHTIVNLICHLLASDQRVLVTSHAARALTVLRDFIREKVSEIAPLCVVLLGDDRNAFQAMEDSVQGITNRHNTWSAERNARDVAELERQLDLSRRDEAAVLQDIRAVREAETYVHPQRFGSYKGTAQAIAKQLHREASLYGWFQDRPTEEVDPPVSEAEATEFVSLMRDDELSLAEDLPWAAVDPKSLLSPPECKELLCREEQAQRQCEAAASAREHPAYPFLQSKEASVRERLDLGLSALLLDFERIARHIQPWTEDAARQIMADQDRRWRELFDASRRHLDAIGDRGRWVDETNVSGLGGRDRNVIRADAESLLVHLVGGGGLGVGPFRAKPVRQGRYLLREIRVAGRLCNSTKVLRDLLMWIDINERLEALSALWSDCGRVSSATAAGRIAEYQDLCEPLEAALKLYSKITQVRAVIAEIPGVAEPVWHDPDALRSFRSALLAVRLENDLDAAVASINDGIAWLQRTIAGGDVDPRTMTLLDALRTRDSDRYVTEYDELARHHRTQARLTRRRELRRKLKAGAPELAESLTANPHDSAWDERIAILLAAWRWAQAKGWMARLSDPRAEERLRIRLDGCRDRIRKLVLELAASKAWAHCFQRMTEHERQHLVAWKQAVRRIGKGKGKYAPLHRRAAREHMQECRTAIPAWIMPVYRVAESIQPGTELFDVVIVDEASQSGPEALFLPYLARKMVVVGDDKQISPDFVGLDREDVNQLRERHIAALPHSDAYGADNSFFDLAEIRYGGRIRLREHFRCMPEIIQFSNNLCYRAEPLIPLKQYGAGRLKPVVAVRHVKDGYRKGGERGAVNPPEAQAIVNEIKHCCENPAYDNKTIGVISLLGHHQSQHTETLLLEQLGPEEMERRKLVCGDAYAFQGDERDIMFLSLVSALPGGGRIGTLASARDERRFNVAASRAREQLWLFHTATLNDLSPQCLRYKLLQYCLNPSVNSASVDGVDVKELKRLSATADRDRTRAPSPFESWFEIDVFLRVVDRGYRVIPQYEVAGYRIDLVVEGMEQRLAVECDGDRWHGADRYLEDVARERALERCGWRFWRVRGSTFYSDQKQALDGLWEALDRAGVFPVGREPAPGNTAGVECPPYHARASTAPEGTMAADVVRHATSSPQDARPEQRPDGAVASELEQNGEHEELSRGESSDDSAGVPQEEALGPLADAPYRTWTPMALPDPRVANIEEISPPLVEIVSAQGPMPCHHAYRLFAKAAGLQRAGRQVRSALNRAMSHAIRKGLVSARNEHGSAVFNERIVRKIGSPQVVVRSRGDRDFHEVPPSEVAQLMVRIRSADPGLSGTELFRRVLEFYGISRMTTNIQEKLCTIESRRVELLADGSREDIRSGRKDNDQ